MEGSIWAALCLGLGFLVGASVSQECGGELTDPSGLITSPGYPDSYPPNSHCNWKIQVPPTRRITLAFNEFHLENVEDCFPAGPGDYVTVTDPEADSHVFCGQNHPWVIESAGDTLYVTFASDADDQHGFRFSLSYMSISKCEEGWEEFGDDCYYFSDEELLFVEAKEDCAARNAQLASVHSREEQEFLQKHSKRGTLFIGAVNTGDLRNNSLNFEFLDDSLKDYHNIWQYEAVSPLNCGSPGCGIVLVPDRWANRDCSETRPVICQSAQSFGEDWFCSGGQCFHVSTQPFAFDSARSYCLSFFGADILCIGNDENKPVRVALGFEAYFPHPLSEWNEHWIGLMRDVGGAWGWVDGSPYSLDRWEEGNPIDNGGDCAVSVTSSWDDLISEWSESFVCKKSPGVFRPCGSN